MKRRKIAFAAAAAVAAAIGIGGTVVGPLSGSGHAGVTWGADFAPPPPTNPGWTTSYWQFR